MAPEDSASLTPLVLDEYTVDRKESALFSALLQMSALLPAAQKVLCSVYKATDQERSDTHLIFITDED